MEPSQDDQVLISNSFTRNEARFGPGARILIEVTYEGPTDGQRETKKFFLDSKISEAALALGQKNAERYVADALQSLAERVLTDTQS